MDNVTPTYTKSRLVKELAFKAGISQVKARLALNTIREIICREAAQSTFILPGVCKFDTVIRKERRMRNPRTGAALILPEHKVLRLTPAKVIRDAVAPRVAAVAAPPEPEEPVAVSAPVSATAPVEAVSAPAPEPAPAAAEPVAAIPEPAPVEPAPAPVAPAVAEAPKAEAAPVVEAAAAAVEEPAPAPVSPAPAPVEQPPAPAPAPAVAEAPKAEAAPVSVDDFILPGATPAPAPVAPPPPPAAAEELPDITFHCPACGQEIEAPGDMAGMEAECPMCGHLMRVPSANPSAAAPSGQKVVSASEAEEIDPRILKNKTIRIDAIDLGLEERGPAGQAAQENLISFFCPGCHQEIEATIDMAGTISECPNCGTEFEVPFFSEKGTIHAESEELFDPRKVEKEKHKTMRIDLDDF